MGFPGDAGGKNLPAMQETQVPSLGREDPWRRKWQTTPVFLPRKFHGQRRATVHGVTKSQTWLSTHTGQDIILRVWPQMEFWSWEMLSLKIILQETLYPYFLKFHRVHLYVKGSCNKEIYISLLNLTCRRRQWHPTPVLLLENPMDGGAWWAAVHGVSKSRTRLSDFTLTFHFHALEKEMATHSSVLAWRIPGTGEPGGLLSMGSYRVGNDWSDLAAAT